MSSFFVDTSALAKRYVAEIGSRWIGNVLSPASGNVSIISKLALVEMYSLVARQRKGGILSSASVTQIHQQLALHATNDYLTVSVDDQILASAQILVDRHTLRSLDGIQLACALDARTRLPGPIILLSADPNLLAAAVAEGFAIDNPLNYP